MGNRKGIATKVWKKIFPFRKGERVRVVIPDFFWSYCPYKSYSGRIGKIESNVGLIEYSKDKNKGYYIERGEEGDRFWIVVFRRKGCTSHIFINEEHLERVT